MSIREVFEFFNFQSRDVKCCDVKSGQFLCPYNPKEITLNPLSIAKALRVYTKYGSHGLFWSIYSQFSKLDEPINNPMFEVATALDKKTAYLLNNKAAIGQAGDKPARQAIIKTGFDGVVFLTHPKVKIGNSVNFFPDNFQNWGDEWQNAENEGFGNDEIQENLFVNYCHALDDLFVSLTVRMRKGGFQSNSSFELTTPLVYLNFDGEHPPTEAELKRFEKIIDFLDALNGKDFFYAK